jgi:hypothetical protein
MELLLAGISPSAENATQQSPGRGREVAEALGWIEEYQPCKGGTATITPLQGWFQTSTLPRACALGFAVSRFQRWAFLCKPLDKDEGLTIR